MDNLWLAAALGIGFGAASVGAVHAAGVQRERGTYPVILAAIASSYLIFAVYDEIEGSLAFEATVSFLFLAVAVVGARISLWLVVYGLIAHVAFNLSCLLMMNCPVPASWSAFCATFSLAVGVGLAAILMRGDLTAAPH